MKTIIATIAILAAAVGFGDTERQANQSWVLHKIDEIVGTNTAALVANATNDTLQAAKDYADAHSGGGGGISSNAVVDIIHETVNGAARPLPRYLHALEFADSYTNEAAAYYRSRGNGKVDGGCSSVRDGGFLYRNFDYPFDDRAEFVVSMSAGDGRFASVGVAQVGTNLTERIVTSGKWSKWYKALPGATVDGVNENGVCIEINVTATNGVENWSGNKVHCLGAVRWTLDNATNAQHAAEYLADNIYVPDGLGNFQYMVADEKDTFYVANGVATSFSNSNKVVTNFNLLSGKGSGKERCVDLVKGANITNVWYTNAYSEKTYRYPGQVLEWYSDFDYDFALVATSKVLWAQKPKEAHRGESLNGHTWWQSVHTSIYDISNRVLRVAVQETDDWYTFAVPSAGGVKPDAVREIVQPIIEANEKTGTDQQIVRGEFGDDAWYTKKPVSDALTASYAESAGSASSADYAYEVPWSGVRDTPTTLFNYGITDAATHDQLQAVDDKADSALAQSEATREVVTTLVGQVNGSNVVIVVTNYLSGAYILDAAKLQIRELRDGQYRTVYNSRDEILLHLGDFETNKLNAAKAELRAEIAAVLAEMQHDAWGRRTSTGNPAPSNTIYTTEPSFVFGGGLEYERIAVGAGAIGILMDKGAPSYTAGDSGTFLFKDATGESYFGYSMTSGYAIGVPTDGIQVTGQRVTLTYNIVGSCPIVMWCPALFPGCAKDITGAGWYQLNDEEGNPIEGAPFECAVDMESTPEVATVYIDTGANPTGFFSAWTSVPGKSSFKTNMPMDLDAANGGGVVSSDGHTVIVPQPDGTWRPSNAN